MRKALLAGLVSCGVLMSMLISAPASARVTIPVPPPSDHIVIELVTVNGTGCPPGSAAVATSPDNTAFTVTYSLYTALVGIGSTPTGWRKNCQLNVLVHVPQGFTYAVSSVDYRGFASLAPGAVASQRANYYFQGQPQTSQIIHPIASPADDFWERTDNVDLAALVWAPCGVQRNLNINTELRVQAGTSNPATTTSFLTMDSTDGEIETTYHFSWATCPGTRR